MKMIKIDESWYQRPPGVPESHSAGGVVVRWEENHLRVALVQEDGFPDYILPKGTIEAGEDFEMTARREIGEEAGLAGLVLLGELGARERLNARKRAWKITHYFLYYTGQHEAFPTDRIHTYRCDWFPVEQLPSMFWPEQKELLESSRETILSLAQRFLSG